MITVFTSFLDMNPVVFTSHPFIDSFSTSWNFAKWKFWTFHTRIRWNIDSFSTVTVCLVWKLVNCKFPNCWLMKIAKSIFFAAVLDSPIVLWMLFPNEFHCQWNLKAWVFYFGDPDFTHLQLILEIWAFYIENGQLVSESDFFLI